MAAKAPQEALALLKRAICSEGRFDRQVSRWLFEAFVDYAQAQGKKSIEQCLGLAVGRGHRSAARQLTDINRLAAFAAVWKLIDADPKLSLWRRCEIFSAEVVAFRRDFWPAWQAAGIPAGASDLRRALFDLFASAETPPPMSTYRIYEVLKRNPELTQDRDLA